MTTRLSIALKGELRDHMLRERKAAEKASPRATRRVGSQLKLDIRAAVNRTFTGSKILKSGNRRIAGAIRDKTYANADGTATTLVFSKAGRKDQGIFVDILVPFTKPGRNVIRPRNKKFLHISFAKGKGRHKRFTVGGTERRDRNVFFQKAKSGGRVYIVRRNPNAKIKRTELLGVLIPRATLKTRLELEQPIKKAEQTLPKAYLEEVDKLAP